MLTSLTAPTAVADVSGEAPLAWYPVWSAVLSHGLPPNAANVLILRETIAAPWSQLSGTVPGEAPAEDADEAAAERAFLEAPLPPEQGSAFGLDEHFTLDTRYTLMDRKTVNALFRRGPKIGWDELYRRFPEVPGLVSLSAVRFTETRDAASVYLAFGCGPGCGAGRVVFLARDEALNWQITDSELTWVASE